MNSETVAQDMFTVLHGQPAPVVTRWTYSTADPFAVTLGIRGRGDRFVEWLVARDLVLASLAGPAGCGDILMSPQHVQGYEIVEIEIRSPDGRAVLEVDRELLVRFVDAAVALVPVGEESARMDLDAEILKITRSCAG
jgi:hypothetical protein